MRLPTHFLAAAAVGLLFAGGLPADAGTRDLRIRVSSKSLGYDKRGDSRTSRRQLKIMIDNRGQEDLKGLTLEWAVAGRDINSRKYTLAGSGRKTVTLVAGEETEVTSDPVSFSKKEGKVEQRNNNRNQPPTYKVDPDTGTRYAGYVVVIKQDGQIVAEAATAGMKARLKKLKPAKK